MVFVITICEQKHTMVLSLLYPHLLAVSIKTTGGSGRTHLNDLPLRLRTPFAMLRRSPSTQPVRRKKQLTTGRSIQPVGEITLTGASICEFHTHIRPINLSGSVSTARSRLRLVCTIIYGAQMIRSRCSAQHDNLQQVIADGRITFIVIVKFATVSKLRCVRPDTDRVSPCIWHQIAYTAGHQKNLQEAIE